MTESVSHLVTLPILGEVDVDAIYRNPNTRLYRKRNGRKPMYESGSLKRHLALLTPELAEKARALGDGNFSAGVRLALEKA